MPKYQVTITAKISKTYTIEESTPENAVESAHEIFSVLHDDAPESYTQDTERVEEIKESA